MKKEVGYGSLEGQGMVKLGVYKTLGPDGSQRVEHGTGNEQWARGRSQTFRDQSRSDT